MISAKAKYRNNVRAKLLDLLKKEKAFWSYSNRSISMESVEDDQLIAMTMRYLDLDEINMLFQVFSYKKIKNAWKQLLVPEGDYLYTLNRFFAWYYFKAKRPDSYLKSLETRRFNQLFNY